MTLDIFDVFECELLRDYPDEGLRKGRIAYGCRMPHDRIYLSAMGKAGPHAGESYQGPVFETDAQLGVDFSVSPDIEAALQQENPFERTSTPGYFKRR